MFKVWDQVKLKDGDRAGVVTAVDGKNPQEKVVVRFDDGITEEAEVATLMRLN